VSIILPNLAAPRHHHLLGDSPFLVVRPFQLRRYLPLPPEVNSFFRQRQRLLFVQRFFSFEFRVSTALSPSAARRPSVFIRFSAFLRFRRRYLIVQAKQRFP
jgi:hypothetical protein